MPHCVLSPPMPLHPFNSFIRKSNGRLSGTSNKKYFSQRHWYKRYETGCDYRRRHQRAQCCLGIKKKQIPFILFEAAKRCGGAIQTLHEADCLIEAGPNSLSGPHPELDRLITELELNPNIVLRRARRTTVLLCAMANRLPCLIRPSASCAHRSSPPVLNGDYSQSPLFAQKQLQVSLAAFAERRLGKEL